MPKCLVTENNMPPMMCHNVNSTTPRLLKLIENTTAFTIGYRQPAFFIVLLMKEGSRFRLAVIIISVVVLKLTRYESSYLR